MSKTPWVGAEWVERFSRVLHTGKARGARLTKFFESPGLRFTPEWGWRENILGVCLTKKKRQTRLTFLVRRRIAEGRLKTRQVIPELLRHSEIAGEIPTRVLECGDEFRLQSSYTGTLKPGMAIGHGHGFDSGTIGFIVASGPASSPTRHIVSCAHVLALTRTPFFPPAEVDDWIEQPVSLDADPPDFQVARLQAGFSDLTQRTVMDDRAFAKIDPEVKSRGGEAVGISNRADLQDFPSGLALSMRGQEAGPVSGKVTGTKAAIKIPTQGRVNFDEWTYTNVIIHDMPNAPGDSGAGVLDNDRLAVGLHFAGNGSIGLFYPIGPFLQENGFRIG